MGRKSDIVKILRRIDGKGYRFYKELEGEYHLDKFKLYIDRVQSDPFAPPSDFRIIIDNTFPEEFYENRSRLIAFEDFLTRRFYSVASSLSRKVGSGKSGLISILKPSNQILRRSCVIVDSEIEVRFHVGLPARGRRILGKEAEKIILEKIPRLVEKSLIFRKNSYREIENHVKIAEDADFIRSKLRKENLVAFVADGSILPRESGISERPLMKAVKFESPESLRVEFDCPNRKIAGMGLKEGVTLIVGGAYHGKSTLLDALSKGVYNHIPGDGREFVVTREDAVEIRAEDGRYVANVDISPFISNLPNGIDTSNFSTENASGSTSQAASISEALELGSRLFLIDEDTSATNLMFRDRRMQELVPKEKEPITPLIDLIPSLKREGVSIIMVAGGIGEYFDVADTVVMMEKYLPRDVTSEAREISERFRSNRFREMAKEIRIKKRCPLKESFSPYIGGKKKVKIFGMERVVFGRHLIDLSAMKQLVEVGQVRAICDVIQILRKRFSGRATLREILESVNGKIIDILPDLGIYAEPRIFEVGFALNRLRGLKCEQRG